MTDELKQTANSSKLNNYVCPISKQLEQYSPSESTSYYNPGPHGQHGELDSRSGQCDSSVFLGFFLMNIVSATCLVIVCLLVLMGLVNKIFYANVSKHLQGPNWRCRVNNCTADNEAAVE